MKKIIMVFIAAVLMGTVAMAQDGNNRQPKQDKTAMIQKRTNSIVKKYGLNDEQAKKLLELNTKYADTMRSRQGNARRGNMRQGFNRGPQLRGDSMRVKRTPLTDEQKAERKASRTKMMESMKVYDAELQTIMTTDQYGKYKADVTKRKSARMKRQ